MKTAVSFWRRASKSICKSACYSLLGHYTSYSICLKHTPMSPGTFVSIQMNLCKTKTKLKKPANHRVTWPPTAAAQLLSAVHPALTVCEIQKPECAPGAFAISALSKSDLSENPQCVYSPMQQRYHNLMVNISICI